MQIVIDIDEKDLRLIELHQPCELTEEYLETIFMKIENGTPLEKVLEDIKAEIKDEAEFAYADFERYKVECLGQDWEDAYDGLPQDDYRYGMQRALEIICKHISGKDTE